MEQNRRREREAVQRERKGTVKCERGMQDARFERYTPNNDDERFGERLNGEESKTSYAIAGSK